jgi:2-polyprenyl-6-methoxyphenol hydroxylase-like FAD-dependent oxidoreductase
VGAGIVIGADGLRSTMARLVEAPTYREGRYSAGVVYAFFRGLENAGNRWYYRPGVSVGAIPTHDDDTCIFMTTTSARFEAEVHSDMEAGFRRLLEECSLPLSREVSVSVQSERFRGHPGHLGYMRQSHGPGWALVGDAGYFKDPITAHGISDALRDAEFLARGVLQGTDQALARYQSNRDELSGELFDLTDEIAGFEWDLEQLQPIHRKLSHAMNHEVEALLGLDESAETPAMKIVKRSANSGSSAG